MDFHSMNRKQLQTLCKEHGIPANSTNIVMADRLTARLKESEETLLETSAKSSEGGKTDSVKKGKKVKFSPECEIYEFTRSVRPKRKAKVTTKVPIRNVGVGLRRSNRNQPSDGGGLEEVVNKKLEEPNAEEEAHTVSSLAKCKSKKQDDDSVEDKSNIGETSVTEKGGKVLRSSSKRHQPIAEAGNKKRKVTKRSTKKKIQPEIIDLEQDLEPVLPSDVHQLADDESNCLEGDVKEDGGKEQLLNPLGFDENANKSVCDETNCLQSDVKEDGAKEQVLEPVLPLGFDEGVHELVNDDKTRLGETSVSEKRGKVLRSSKRHQPIDEAVNKKRKGTKSSTKRKIRPEDFEQDVEPVLPLGFDENVHKLEDDETNCLESDVKEDGAKEQVPEPVLPLGFDEGVHKLVDDDKSSLGETSISEKGGKVLRPSKRHQHIDEAVNKKLKGTKSSTKKKIQPEVIDFEQDLEHVLPLGFDEKVHKLEDVETNCLESDVKDDGAKKQVQEPVSPLSFDECVHKLVDDDSVGDKSSSGETSFSVEGGKVLRSSKRHQPVDEAVNRKLKGTKSSTKKKIRQEVVDFEQDLEPVLPLGFDEDVHQLVDDETNFLEGDVKEDGSKEQLLEPLGFDEDVHQLVDDETNFLEGDVKEDGSKEQLLEPLGFDENADKSVGDGTNCLESDENEDGGKEQFLEPVLPLGFDEDVHQLADDETNCLEGDVKEDGGKEQLLEPLGFDENADKSVGDGANCLESDENEDGGKEQVLEPVLPLGFDEGVHKLMDDDIVGDKSSLEETSVSEKGGKVLPSDVYQLAEDESNCLAGDVKVDGGKDQLLEPLGFDENANKSVGDETNCLESDVNEGGSKERVLEPVLPLGFDEGGHKLVDDETNCLESDIQEDGEKDPSRLSLNEKVDPSNRGDLDEGVPTRKSPKETDNVESAIIQNFITEDVEKTDGSKGKPDTRAEDSQYSFPSTNSDSENLCDFSPLQTGNMVNCEDKTEKADDKEEDDFTMDELSPSRAENMVNCEDNTEKADDKEADYFTTDDFSPPRAVYMVNCEDNTENVDDKEADDFTIDDFSPPGNTVNFEDNTEKANDKEADDFTTDDLSPPRAGNMVSCEGNTGKVDDKEADDFPIDDFSPPGNMVNCEDNTEKAHDQEANDFTTDDFSSQRAGNLVNCEENTEKADDREADDFTKVEFSPPRAGNMFTCEDNTEKADYEEADDLTIGTTCEGSQNSFLVKGCATKIDNQEGKSEFYSDEAAKISFNKCLLELEGTDQPLSDIRCAGGVQQSSATVSTQKTIENESFFNDVLDNRQEFYLEQDSEKVGVNETEAAEPLPQYSLIEAQHEPSAGFNASIMNLSSFSFGEPEDANHSSDSSDAETSLLEETTTQSALGKLHGQAEELEENTNISENEVCIDSGTFSKVIDTKYFTEEAAAEGVDPAYKKEASVSALESNPGGCSYIDEVTSLDIYASSVSGDTCSLDDEQDDLKKEAEVKPDLQNSVQGLQDQFGGETPCNYGYMKSSNLFMETAEPTMSAFTAENLKRGLKNNVGLDLIEDYVISEEHIGSTRETDKSVAAKGNVSSATEYDYFIGDITTDYGEQWCVETKLCAGNVSSNEGRDGLLVENSYAESQAVGLMIDNERDYNIMETDESCEIKTDENPDGAFWCLSPSENIKETVSGAVIAEKTDKMFETLKTKPAHAFLSAEGDMGAGKKGNNSEEGEKNLMARTTMKLKTHDMKENATGSKIDQVLNLTAPRTSKRLPLQDLNHI